MTKPPETIWARQDGENYGNWYILREGMQPFSACGPVEYRRADLPPKIKSLVWSRTGDVFYAEGVAGEYSFNLQDIADGEGFQLYLGSTPLTNRDFHIPDDAKVFAGNHHEALILRYTDEGVE